MISLHQLEDKLAVNSEGRSFSYIVKAKSKNVSGTIVSGKCWVLVVLNLVNVQEMFSNVLVGCAVREIIVGMSEGIEMSGKVMGRCRKIWRVSDRSWEFLGNVCEYVRKAWE